MRKYAPKLTMGLLAALLIGGCSSGGGTTSSGDGLGVQTTESNLLVLSSLSPGVGGGFEDESVSVDVTADLCEAGEVTANDDGTFSTTEPVFEPGLTTKFGNLTIVSRDLVDASGLTPVEFFPEGLVFTRYQVSYSSPNAFAPTLRDRTFQQTMVLPNGSSEATFSIILVDLDVILQEFRIQTSGSPASYNVKVTASGAEFNGKPLSVSAETFLEIGNFDRCEDTT